MEQQHLIDHNAARNQYLSQHKRLGASVLIDEFFPLSVDVKILSNRYACSSVMVRHRDCTMVAAITAQLGRPTQKQEKGSIVVSYDCLSGTPNEGFNPRFAAESNQSLLADAVLDTTQLYICIEAAWHLFCDVHVLDCGANTADTGLFAIQCALAQLKLPEVIIDQAANTVSVDVSKHKTLKVKCIAACNFCVMNDGNLIVDPMLFEAKLFDEHVTIVMADTILSIRKTGILSVGDNIIRQAIQKSEERRKDLVKIFNKFCNTP